jgi:hypothetical protein
MIITGTLKTFPDIHSKENGLLGDTEDGDIGYPWLITIAKPRKPQYIPKVTTKEGIFALTTKIPFAKPINAPYRRVKSMLKAVGNRHMISMVAIITPLEANTDSKLKSIIPVKTTNASPTATIINGAAEIKIARIFRTVKKYGDNNPATPIDRIKKRTGFAYALF